MTKMIEKPEKANEKPFFNNKALFLTFPDSESEATKQLMTIIYFYF